LFRGARPANLAGMNTQTVRLGTLDIAYVDIAGPPPPLLFLHGVTDSLESYASVLELLDGRHRMLAMDFRGHGLTQHWAGDYRVSDYSDDVQQFLTTVAAEPTLVAGHSLGALVATFTAAAAPHLVRGVFLEDPPFYSGQMPAIKETPDYQVFLALRELLQRHHETAESIDTLAELVGAWPIHPRLFGGRSLLEIGGPDLARDRAVSLHRMDVSTLDPVLDGSQFDGFDPDHALALINAPIRLVAGNVDLGGAIAASDVRRLQSLAVDYGFELMGDVGHFIHHTAPHEYARAVSAFAAACT
jgi:pimeloyl-ACP methyl ester carboxylesterase